MARHQVSVFFIFILWRRVLTVCLLLLLGTGPHSYGLEQKARTSHLASEEKSALAGELVSFVEKYIEAGQTANTGDRAKFLAPKVLYYGRALTQRQAEKEIISLYRRWPTRKYGQLEQPEIFAIPKRRDVYKVTGLYDYELVNLGERLSGKSRITCVLEHSRHGILIIGLDEKLVTDTTQYSRD
jgi:hypothetical protein